MRTRMFVLASSCIFLPGPLSADDIKKKVDGDQAVKEIDLTDLKVRRPPVGRVDKPTVVTMAKNLSRFLREKKSLEAVEKQIDFTKQKAVFFFWLGSGGDRLTFTTKEAKKRILVNFMYKRGLTKDLRGHVHLFVVPKNATLSVKQVR